MDYEALAASLADKVSEARAQLARAEKVIAAARNLMSANGAMLVQARYNELESLLAEYDRASAPLDAQEGGT